MFLGEYSHALDSKGRVVMPSKFRSGLEAGCVVTKGQVVPPGSLVMGMPARVERQLPLDEQRAIRGWAEKYLRVAAEHRAKLEREAGDGDS